VETVEMQKVKVPGDAVRTGSRGWTSLVGMVWKALGLAGTMAVDGEGKEMVPGGEVKNGSLSEAEQDVASVRAEDGVMEDGELAEGLEYAFLDSVGDFDLRGAYRKDAVFRTIYDKFEVAGGPLDGFTISEDGTLLYDTLNGSRVCIPATLLREALYVAHDSLGHLEYKKTYFRLAARFYRPRLAATVENYIRGCPKCTINKTSRSKLPGNLMPVDTPNRSGVLAAFECVGIDFIVHLPLSMGCDAIMVVIDKFTRYGIFIPTTSDYTASSTTRLFLNHVVSMGWLPSKFITDRDGKFLSDFWQVLMQALDVKHAPSTAYHAQTDGATERLNQTLEVMLHAYTSPMQDDWCEHLPLVQLAYNTAPNSSTGHSPIQLLHI